MFCKSMIYYPTIIIIIGNFTGNARSNSLIIGIVTRITGNCNNINCNHL